MPATLNSWKEIAGSLNQPIHTVRRWELQEGLPVHRVANRKHARVFAVQAEIQHWLRTRELTNKKPPRTVSSSQSHREYFDRNALSKQRELREDLRQLMGIHKQRVTLLMSAARNPNSPKPTAAKQQAQVEEALSRISEKVIEALEQERTRIGRELHDNINQRLALVIIAMDQMKKDARGLLDVRHRLGEIRKQIMEITSDVHEVAYSLHPAKLEFLGLTAAIRSECKTVAARHEIEVKFHSNNVPRVVPTEISLCLFRIVQEALHNAARHSKAKHIEVQLRGTGTDIDLVIRDSGRGFDVRIAGGEGLGLTSMRERARLMRGTLVIRSKPKAGTLIRVSVPFRVAEAEQTYAGTSVA